MYTTTATPSPGSMCPGASLAPTEPPDAPPFATIFPPRDADDDTYRRWIATSPWPEVVFAAAGAR
ncbi:MAG: hypothetical protein WBL35_16325 [Ornithinibacter sp.]